MNTFKHIASNIDKATLSVAWHCYVKNQRKWYQTMIHSQIDRKTFGDIHLKHGINFHWQHQNQACAIHSKPGNY